MFWTEHVLEDEEGAHLQAVGLLVVADHPVEVGEASQRLGNVRVVLGELRLADLQRTLEPLLCLGIVRLVEEQDAEVIEAGPDIQVIGAQRRLPNR